MADELFRMTIDDVFRVPGRGTIVTGTVERGTVRVGDTVAVGTFHATVKGRVERIERFRRTLDAASSGDSVGLEIAGLEDADVQPKDTLAGTGDDGDRPRQR